MLGLCAKSTTGIGEDDQLGWGKTWKEELTSFMRIWWIDRDKRTDAANAVANITVGPQESEQPKKISKALINL